MCDICDIIYIPCIYYKSGLKLAKPCTFGWLYICYLGNVMQMFTYRFCMHFLFMRAHICILTHFLACTLCDNVYGDYEHKYLVILHRSKCMSLCPQNRMTAADIFSRNEISSSKFHYNIITSFSIVTGPSREFAGPGAK